MNTPVKLRRRILAATMIVAVVAVTATAVSAVQLTRSTDTAAARAELSAQADRIAAAQPAARRALAIAIADLNDESYVVIIPAEGSQTGSSGLVPARILAQLRGGRDVSTIATIKGINLLIEARATTDGGGVVVGRDTTTVHSLAPTGAVRILGALLIGAAVATIAALIASRALTRPLERLSARAQRLADGERGLPTAATGVIELENVDAALSALDTALAHSEGRQHEFLLSVSHEMRTPLTAIRGYGEALADGVIPADELAEVGRTLTAESARLTAFTNDLLALARLEADDFRLNPSRVLIGEILTAAEAAWRATARAGDVSIKLAAVPDLVVETDAARVRQLIDGLLENALRLSPAGSTVMITASAEPNAVVISVADDGPGLADDDISHAFERGFLRDRYRSSRPVGTGLGLSIAARLVERMGGSISATSPVTGGTTFRIALPR